MTTGKLDLCCENGKKWRGWAGFTV